MDDGDGDRSVTNGHEDDDCDEERDGRSAAKGHSDGDCEGEGEADLQDARDDDLEEVSEDAPDGGNGISAGSMSAWVSEAARVYVLKSAGVKVNLSSALMLAAVAR